MSTQHKPLVITRNGVEWTFTTATFGKRSKAFKGKEFPVPTFSKENFDKGVIWFGIDDVLQSMNKTARRIGGEIFTASWEDNFGEGAKHASKEAAVEAFNAQIAADWVDFSAGIVKLSDIQDDIDELVDEQQTLIASTPESQEDVDKMFLRLKELAAQIQPLKAEAAAITAKYAVRAEKRKATKAAKEAAEAKAAGTAVAA